MKTNLFDNRWAFSLKFKDRIDNNKLINIKKKTDAAFFASQRVQKTDKIMSEETLCLDIPSIESITT